MYNIYQTHQQQQHKLLLLMRLIQLRNLQHQTTN